MCLLKIINILLGVYKVNDIIKDIGEFIFIEDELQTADIIFVVGGSHPELGEKAAELWHDSYAPLCFVGGGVSIKSGVFPGPKSNTQVYNQEYKTEFDFFFDVLLKNGVNSESIVGENKSGFTRENADFAKVSCDKMNIKVNKAILVCKKFHARRSLMFYQSAFPNTDFCVTTIDGYNITKENWFKTEQGVNRVLGELRRCGDQFNSVDVSNYIK